MGKRERQVYRFGPFLLDTTERRLWRGGEAISLTAKLFDLLTLFVRRSGHLLEKEELLRLIWPDTIVEENNLTVSISALRKALGERRGERKYIETVPRIGYRFVAEVQEETSGQSPASVVESELAAAPEKSLNSLAVLPLKNVSADPQLEYLSDGISESIINDLSQLPHLRVMARSTAFRYKAPAIDPQQVGRELQVRAVLTGRLLQVADRLVFRVELVDVMDGAQLWGGQYDRPVSDLIVLQEEIAREVSEKLRLRLTAEDRLRLAKHYTENPEAFQLYLKGRFFWNKFSGEGWQKAIEYFQRAIEIDPTYALAYAGLSDAYSRISSSYRSPREAIPRARAAAFRAVEIDDTLAEAHVALSFIKESYDFDLPAARREAVRAIELNPGYALAHRRYGACLMLSDRFDEALAEFYLALELDPLSVHGNVIVGTCLLFARRYAEAIQQLQSTLELDPDYYVTHYTLGCAFMQQDRFAEAIAEFEQVCRLQEKFYVAKGLIGHTYAIAGQRREALKVLRELQQSARTDYVTPHSFALIYAGLGESEQAFAWLEKMYEERNDWLVWLKHAPGFDRLRTDERFADLLRRIANQRRPSNPLA